MLDRQRGLVQRRSGRAPQLAAPARRAATRASCSCSARRATPWSAATRASATTGPALPWSATWRPRAASGGPSTGSSSRTCSRDNRWGIYVQYADWIDVAANVYENNKEADAPQRRRRHQSDRTPGQPQDHPAAAGRAGRAVARRRSARRSCCDASGEHRPRRNTLSFRWDLGDGTIARQSARRARLQGPGLLPRRVDRQQRPLFRPRLARLLRRSRTARRWAPKGRPPIGAGSIPQSKVRFSDDRRVRIAGSSSVLAHVEPYSGMMVSLALSGIQEGRRGAGGQDAAWCSGSRPSTRTCPRGRGRSPSSRFTSRRRSSSCSRPKARFHERGVRTTRTARAGATSSSRWPGASSGSGKGELPATLNYLTDRLRLLGRAAALDLARRDEHPLVGESLLH